MLGASDRIGGNGVVGQVQPHRGRHTCHPRRLDMEIIPDQLVGDAVVLGSTDSVYENVSQKHPGP